MITASTVGAICDRFGGEVQTGPFGSQLHSSDYVATGIPVVMPQDMVDGSVTVTRIARVGAEHVRRLSQHRVRAGDVVYSRRGDVSRFAVITDRESGWLCGTGSIRIRLNCSDIEIAYLRRFLQQDSVAKWLEHRAKGVTMPNLNTSIIRDLPIKYPPLTEQRRIAAILDLADALRAKRRVALKQFDEMAQAAFIEMFGDPTKPGDRTHMRPFGALGKIQLGKMLDQRRQTGTHSRPYLRNANVRWFWFDLSNVFEMDFDERDREKYSLRRGDLLICEGGEPGRAAIWKGELKDCYFQKALHRFRPNLQVVLSEYLAQFLWLMASRGGLKDYISTSTIAHLTKEKLETLMVPLPPVQKQQTFKERSDAIDVLRTKYVEAATAAESLFASLQHHAFRGEL